MATEVSSGGNVLLYFLAIFVPPLPVFFKRGLKADFWINILLWIFGWIPGVIHAWYIISRHESRSVVTTGAPQTAAVPTTTAPYTNAAPKAAY